MTARVKLRRVRLFSPKWDGPIEGYTKNFLKKNFWRVQRLMEYSDALSECYCTFLHLQKRYFGTVDNAAWFMSLYQVSLMRRFATLSLADSKHRARFVYIEEQDADGVPHPTDSGTLGEFISDLEKAPEEALALLRLLLDAPVNFVRAIYTCEDSAESLELLVGTGMSFSMLRDSIKQVNNEKEND